MHGILTGGSIMSAIHAVSAKEMTIFLRVVAEFRVQGKDWETIGATLKMPVAGMRKAIDDHEASFLLLLKKARRDHRKFCFDCALEKLREQTQSTNEKISHSASTMLTRLKMAEERIRAQKEQDRRRLKTANQIGTRTLPNPSKQQAPLVNQLAADAILRHDHGKGSTGSTLDEIVKQKMAADGLFIEGKGANSSQIRKV
jgi:hypothetical protein